jgi:hypothetical protein
MIRKTPREILGLDGLKQFLRIGPIRNWSNPLPPLCEFLFIYSSYSENCRHAVISKPKPGLTNELRTTAKRKCHGHLPSSVIG